MAEIVRNYCIENSNDTCYINTSGGFSYFLGIVSSHLKGIHNTIPVIAENEYLYIGCDGSTCFDLADLGMYHLLELYGLSGKWKAVDNTGRYVKFQISAAGINAERAYEKNGRLHLLFTDIDDIQKARTVMALFRDESLNGLIPAIAVITNTSHVANRLRINGRIAVKQTDKHIDCHGLIDQWCNNHFLDEQPGVNGNQLKTEVAVNGVGGDGPPLLVCLGNDPSATVLAICAQRPRIVWMLYSTATIAALAARMYDCASELPMGTMHIIPLPEAGHIGAGISNEALPFLAQHENVLANITPGTKGQTWAFGQLDRVSLCSIYTGDLPVRVAPLDPPGTYRYDVPPISPLLMGRLVGGNGLTSRLSPDSFDADRIAFLCAFARCIRRFEKDGSFVPVWFKQRNSRQSVFRKKGALSISSQWVSDEFRIEIIDKGVSMRGTLSAPANTEVKGFKGDWLEETVAGALYSLDIRDIQVGLEWPWGSWRSKNHHRTEIDVVFPYQNTHVVISVKAYKLTGQARLNEMIAIKAMAQECFGRFSIPMLVHQFPPPSDDIVAAALKTLAETRVLEIPSVLLGIPDALNGLLKKTFLFLRS